MDEAILMSLQDIQQSIDTEQWHEVEHFILTHHSDLFAQGLHRQVSHWINLLPKAYRLSQQINLHLAYALIPDHEARAFNLFSSIYDQAIDDHNIDLAFAAWTGLAECSFYNLNRYSQLKKWVEKADTLLETELLPTQELRRNAFIAAYFSAILFCKPDKKRLIHWQSLAHHALNNSTHPEIRTLLSNHLILAGIWQGDMLQARLLAKEFLGDDSLHDQNPLIFMMQKAVQAQVAWLNTDKEESLRQVKAGLNYSSLSKLHIFDAQLTAQAVYACMVDNDFNGAEKHLKSIEKTKNPHHTLDNSQYHYLTAWVAVSTGDIETAYIHAQRTVELSKIAGIPFTEAISRILLAQVHFEKNNLIRALHHLAKAQRIGKRMGSLHIRYAGLLAQSWAMFQFKRECLALRYLRIAFEIGAKQGYLHIPGWPYKIMDQLCEIALRNTIEPDYAKKLIRLHHIPPANAIDAPADWPWAVKIITLGGFKLYVQGELVIFKRKTQKKPLELLKAVIALGGKDVAIYSLMDKLWPESEGDAVQSVFDSVGSIFRHLIK